MDRIETLLNFLKDSPDDNFLHHALALEYIKAGKDDEAKLLFRGILERNASYVGSYYHLARLLERTGEKQEAIAVYEKGMEAARAAGDNHAYNELQAACEDLAD